MRLRKKTDVTNNKTRVLQHAIEFLEPRQLLTTVHGGDVFQYQDPAGNIDRVVLKGNITAELIGATVGTNNAVQLIDLPGELNGVPVNGGLAGAAGTQLIGNITITDPTVPPGSPQDTTAPAISALASTSTGVSYGIVVTPITTGTGMGATTNNIVQVVQINNATAAATVVAEISGQILAAAANNFVAPAMGGTQVTAVTAAAFNPNNGLLYFVATGGADNTPTLFTVDVSSGNRNTITNSVTAIPGTFQSTASAPSSIGAITFAPNGVLYAAGKIPAGTNELFQVNLTDTDTITTPLPVLFGTTAITGTITGLAFGAGAGNNITALVSNGGTTAGSVLSINDVTGQATNFGSLASGTALGDNPGDLEFNPTLTDPFTGNTGALVATDSATGQLFYVFPTNRGGSAGATLYAIYVSQSDINASISVGQVATANSAIDPFTGTINLQVPTAGSTTPTVIAGPANAGTAVLGAVVNVTPTGATTSTYEPFFGASVNQSFGVLPGSMNTLNAGLIVAPGQNLGNFLFGGTVLGNVNIQASIQTFYAGWLLTGNAAGDTAGTISNPDNFVVDGDIRNLLTAGPIGTEPGALTSAAPSYLTGFDMLVDGTVGQIQTLDPGASPVVGSINVRHDPSVVGLTTPQLQTEFDTSSNFGGFDQGELAGSALVDNNTFDTAQYLGSIDSSTINQNNVAYVTGTLNDSTGNGVNFYAVPLMAGQTITAQLTPSIAGELNLEILNPQGAVVTSDYNTQDYAAAEGKALQFTATEPGIYRFAVTTFDNYSLTTTPASSVGVVPYSLTINGVGNLGLGAVVATGGYMDNTNTASGISPGIGVANGDFGGIYTGGVANWAEGDTPPSLAASTGATPRITGGGAILSNANTETFAVSNGNLRVLEGTSLGATDTLDPEIAVPNGSVGLVESTAGNLFFNHPETTTPNVIGGNYQKVYAAEDLGADLLTDGSIGDISAGTIQNPLNSEFKVGVGGALNQSIALIESTGYPTATGFMPGNFGTLLTGGPQITVGQGGSLGYISVPTGEIYRDDTFGGEQDTPFTYSPGVSATIVDASGNNVTFTPSAAYVVTSKSTSSTSGGTTGGGSTSSSSSSTTVTTLAPAGAITLTLYGIEGDGGNAIIDAESTESLSITASNAGAAQQIHIGRVEIEGTGAPVVDYTPVAGTTATTSSITQPGIGALPGLQLESGTTLVPLTLNITGGTPVDVLDTVVTTGPAATALSHATSIANTTGGEMANILAGSIGTLDVTGPLGTTQNSITGVAVLPRNTVTSSGSLGSGLRPVAMTAGGEINIGDLYPFQDVKTGVLVNAGNVLSVSSNTSIGNVFVLGSIGQLSAGTDGIIAPVAALNGAGSTAPSIGGGSAANPGRILSVDIGGGIAAGGAGSAVGFIDDAQNVVPTPPTQASNPESVGRPGLYADSAIGNITASSGANIYGAIVSKLSIGSISLRGGGSIVNARIGDLTAFNFTDEEDQVVTVITNESPVDRPVTNLGPITISGNGGVIGSIFHAGQLGLISVPDGFGVINSFFDGVGSAYFAGIVAGGYGIRDDEIESYTTTGTLNATGSGVNIGTGNFSASVLFSDSGSINTDTGIAPNPTNDLNAFFNTSASAPQLVGITVTGVISNLQTSGALNLGSAKAYEITATQPEVNPGSFDFANSIGSIVTASEIVGVTIVTGKLGTFAPGGDVVDTTLSIAGTIKSIVLRANFTQGSSIIAAGVNGYIKKLVVDGNMNGTIQANRKISTVNITGTFSGTIKAAQIGTVTMGQGLGTGTLSVYGNINKMIIGGNLAATGNDLIINNKINTLQIAGNLNADVSIASSINNLIVGGSVTSGTKVTVGNILGVLRVAGDVQVGSVIQAKKIRKQLVKGAIDGTIIGG